MNEIICMTLITVVVFALGGLISLGMKIAPTIINFIKWQIFRFSKEDWERD